MPATPALTYLLSTTSGLSIQNRGTTTFQSPLSALHHTRLVMGHTNSVQIMQEDINYILWEEIPLFTVPFIDDVAGKVQSPTMRMPTVSMRPSQETQASAASSGSTSPTSTKFCNGSNMSAVHSLGRNSNSVSQPSSS
jgi:hypothetical protein